MPWRMQIALKPGGVLTPARLACKMERNQVY